MSSIARLFTVAVVTAIALSSTAWAQSDPATKKAVEFVQCLQRGDFNGAYQRVDSNLGFRSSPDKLGSAWQGLTARAGKLVEYREVTVEKQAEYYVVTQVAKFEKGLVKLLVALDSTLRVADFKYLNFEGTRPAPAAPHAQAPAHEPTATPQAQAPSQETTASPQA